METYTSAEVLSSEDLYDIAEAVRCSCSGIKYRMAEDELGWLGFVRGRYAIADYILENIEGDVLTIPDSFGLSKALDDDNRGWGKATCLSDETALQRVFFWCYDECAGVSDVV